LAHDGLAPLIVCFGDSLTAGYQSPRPDRPGMLPTPYGTFLQERLGSRACVAISGVCGEVTGEMVLRFRPDVLEHKPDAVVILGGTNDLGWQADPADIMRNLLKMYELALAAGIHLVAVTVPSIRIEGNFGDREAEHLLAEHVGRRQALNRLIQDYCASKHVPCVDLFTATAEPATLSLATPYSNDGLHLTTEGYRLLGDLLFEEVFAACSGHNPSDRPPGSS
jgi:acyl-CoA thioesterase-1